MKFQGLNVVHFTDSYNVSQILTVGARNVSLQSLVLDIFLAWKVNEIKVVVEFIPRSDPRIVFADKGSRDFDLQDFSLDFDTFLFLSSNYGPFDIDCFASASNKKCVLYVSRDFDEKACSVDFFKTSFVRDFNLFVFPPPFLIVPTLWHLCLNQARGVLIVPLWTSSHFCNFLCDDGKHFNSFVKHFEILSPDFVCNSYIRNNLFRGPQKFKTLAIVFDFVHISKVNMLVSNICSSFCVLGGCVKCV